MGNILRTGPQTCLTASRHNLILNASASHFTTHCSPTPEFGHLEITEEFPEQVEEEGHI